MKRLDRLRFSGAQPTAFAMTGMVVGRPSFSRDDNSVRARLTLLTPAVRPLRFLLACGFSSGGAIDWTISLQDHPAGLAGPRRHVVRSAPRAIRKPRLDVHRRAFAGSPAGSSG